MDQPIAKLFKHLKMKFFNQVLEIIKVVSFCIGFIGTIAFIHMWVLIFREAWTDYIERLAKRYPKK